jgi:ApaG domain
MLQRQCAEFQKTLPQHPSGETMFLLQPPLNPKVYGSHRIFPVMAPSCKEADAVNDLFNILVLFRDWNEDNGEEDAMDWFLLHSEIALEISATLDAYTGEPTLWTTVSSIRKAIRYAFRHAKPSSTSEAQDRQLLNKYAIRALRMLMEQAEMWRLTSVSFENDIRVVATSKHIGSSLMGPGSPVVKNRFSYMIRIENLSDRETVQLLGRYWHIEEVDGGENSKPTFVDRPNEGAGTSNGNIRLLPTFIASVRETLTVFIVSPCSGPTPRAAPWGSFRLHEWMRTGQ